MSEMNTQAASATELSHYKDQMVRLFGDTKLPAVSYKGRFIPQRVLSDYGFLTFGDHLK